MKKVYFLNVDFGKNLTGIERSSLKRACLFKNYLNITPIFLCSKLNLELDEQVERYKKIGWMPESCQVINVYDDLRKRSSGNLAVPLEPQLKYYRADDFKVIDINEKHQTYTTEHSSMLMYIVWRDTAKTKLNYINFFFNKKKIRREKYDLNGFLYLIQYLHDNSKILSEDVVDLQGNVFLKKYYDIEKNILNRIEFYKNKQLRSIFANEQALISDWLLNFDSKPESLLVIDKNRYWSEAASQLRPQCKVISVLHSIHLKEGDLNNVVEGRLNSNYAAVLNGEHSVDMILTLTDAQKSDLEQRYGETHTIRVIPHSLDHQQEAPENKKISKIQNIIAMCRLASEKQLEDMIYIMSKVQQKNPDIRLFIYGEGAERKKLEDLIISLNLNNTVYLPGFVNDLAQVYQTASLSILTSKCEGFSLAVLESLSYGVPVISYDIKYGPSSMIKHTQNGYLFEPKDFDGIANQIDQTLKDEVLVNKLRKNAYLTSLKYTEQVVAEKWKNLLFELY